MKKGSKTRFLVAAVFLAAFFAWTVLLCLVDVRAIGPDGSSVGLAGINDLVHNLTGVNWFLYCVTDWFGLIPIVIAFGFGILGILQWIRRKSLLRVDRSILLLGGFYLLVMAAYLFFETVVVNYRPVLIDGRLEASYPSSTTMLVMCVIPTATIQWKHRIQNQKLRYIVLSVCVVFLLFMVIGRILSGVHWITDILGGALLSTGLVTAYAGAVCKIR